MCTYRNLSFDYDMCQWIVSSSNRAEWLPAVSSTSLIFRFSERCSNYCRSYKFRGHNIRTSLRRQISCHNKSYERWLEGENISEEEEMADDRRIRLEKKAQNIVMLRMWLANGPLNRRIHGKHRILATVWLLLNQSLRYLYGFEPAWKFSFDTTANLNVVSYLNLITTIQSQRRGGWEGGG